MKKLIVLACTLSLLTACGDNIEKKAGEKLAAARAAFERNDYNEAKLQIDSIKILYPKAFDTRKEGIKLMQQVELKEQQESLIYLDSMRSKLSRINILLRKTKNIKKSVTTFGLPKP